MSEKRHKMDNAGSTLLPWLQSNLAFMCRMCLHKSIMSVVA